jgi:hypothetical protein
MSRPAPFLPQKVQLGHNPTSSAEFNHSIYRLRIVYSHHPSYYELHLHEGIIRWRRSSAQTPAKPTGHILRPGPQIMSPSGPSPSLPTQPVAFGAKYYNQNDNLPLQESPRLSNFAANSNAERSSQHVWLTVLPPHRPTPRVRIQCRHRQGNGDESRDSEQKVVSEALSICAVKS